MKNRTDKNRMEKEQEKFCYNFKDKNIRTQGGCRRLVDLHKAAPVD